MRSVERYSTTSSLHVWWAFGAILTISRNSSHPPFFPFLKKRKEENSDRMVSMTAYVRILKFDASLFIEKSSDY